MTAGTALPASLITVSRRPRHLVTSIAVGCAVLIVGGVFADYWSAKPRDVQATFVGRSACIDCHRDQTDAFTDSHHDLAMDLASEETVLGDFDDATLEHHGIVSRMYRDGDRFMIRTEGSSGELEDFEIKYVFGVEPLQQYMVEFDRTAEMPENETARVQVLRVSWDTLNERWFYLPPPDVDDKIEPDDPLHWTGIAQRWQTMCAECHSTNLKRNFDPKSQRYHTTFSEIDVSCESCHGPGSLHVELARGKSLFWDRHHGYGLAELKGDDPTAELETCAPCHSRRGVMDANFHGGESYHNHFNLELLQDETYHDDGQIKDEVYVYGSFIQSTMYRKGIRCTDCHDPHSLELKHPGNETCTSCHQHAAGKYDVPSHHHHEPGTAGAKCVNCHMPHTTYMEVDPRRDHSLRVPRPDLSVRLDTPNACSSCHVKDRLDSIDKKKRGSLQEYADWLNAAEDGDEQIAKAIRETDRWCDEACARWYGEDRLTPFHFAQALDAFRKGQDGAVEEMLKLVSQPEEIAPAIARATALSELASAGVSESVDAAKAALKRAGEHVIVRAAAVDAFQNAPPQTTRKALMPLLKDPSRLVRSEATRVLVSSGTYQQLGPSEQTQVDLALKEVHDGLMVTNDRAGAHMGWAMLCEQRGRYQEAIRAYETAMKIEETMTGPRTNLASLLEQLANRQRGPQGMQMIQRAEKLRAEELPLLGRDAALAPDNADVQYRYGLALYLNGDNEQALEQLKRAVELAPEVEVFRTALRLLKEKLQSQ